jgi:hypothetical protein
MPPYQTFLETIEWAPNCVFPSLANDTHIVDPMNEIILAFDHLLTQLALVGLRVKLLKCKLWSPLRIYSSIKSSLGYIFVTNDLCILGALMGFSDFVIQFLDEVLC